MTSPTQTNDAVRVLVHALDQAGDLLDHVHADRLERPTPCVAWDVGALADHLVATPSKFLAMMHGEEVDWSAPTPHITESWGPEFRVHADDLIHAWHELDGEPPVPAGMQVSELAIHAWDLATALEIPVDRLDPEVAEVGLSFMRASLKPEMRGEAFGPEQSAPPEGGPYATLAAFAGRRPTGGAD